MPPVRLNLPMPEFFQLEKRRLNWLFTRAGIQSFHLRQGEAHLHGWSSAPKGQTPLLLIHGFGADALFGWARQAPLARDRQVIAPDLLWFGESHDTSGDFTAIHQADTLIGLLDSLQVEQVDVAGVSYGGFVTTELVRKYPERIRRVVFIDCPGFIYTLHDYHTALSRLQLDSITSLVVPADPTGVRRLMRLAYYFPPPIPMFVAREVYPHLFSKWRTEKIRLLDALLRLADEIDPEAYRSAHPTLVLWGSHDVLFPPDLGRKLAHAIGPHARFELIPRANHAPNMEHPVRFNRLLRDFLDDAR